MPSHDAALETWTNPLFSASTAQARTRRRAAPFCHRRTYVVDCRRRPEQRQNLVAPVSDHGKAPQWLGELPPVPESVATDVGYLRHLIAHDLGLLQAPEPPALDPLALVPSRTTTLADYPLDDEARSMLAETIAAHVDVTGTLPTDRVMTLEERDDAFVLNCCQGSKSTRPSAISARHGFNQVRSWGRIDR